MHELKKKKLALVNREYVVFQKKKNKRKTLIVTFNDSFNFPADDSMVVLLAV